MKGKMKTETEGSNYSQKKQKKEEEKEMNSKAKFKWVRKLRSLCKDLVSVSGFFHSRPHGHMTLSHWPRLAKSISDCVDIIE